MSLILFESQAGLFFICQNKLVTGEQTDEYVTAVSREKSSFSLQEGVQMLKRRDVCSVPLAGFCYQGRQQCCISQSQQLNIISQGSREVNKWIIATFRY